jgi:site-specific recombinase XerD
MASLLYGAGLRLMECCRLRVKDLDLQRNEIRIRDGKGLKDRVTLVPGKLSVLDSTLCFLCYPKRSNWR